jgi:flagellar basal-body rod protein FlgB
MNTFAKPAFRMLERSLDAFALRQKVTANNIANADTPNFKRADVEFESLLRKALGGGKYIQGFRTHVKHIPIGEPLRTDIRPAIVQDESELKMNNNNNNVDIDYEMAMMAKNQLRYNMLVQQLNHEFSMMRTSIGGGRG